MSLESNIENAFLVVRKTYENIEKFLAEADRVGSDSGFDSITPRFLRYRSDIDTEGWMIDSFIKLYQEKQAHPCESDNGLKNAYIYAIDVSFEDKPEIILSRFEYTDLNSWTKAPIVSEWWGLYRPVRHSNGFKIATITVSDDQYFVSRPKDAKTGESFWDLKEVVFKKTDLISIKATNINQRIFKEFEKLKAVEVRTNG